MKEIIISKLILENLDRFLNIAIYQKNDDSQVQTSCNNENEEQKAVPFLNVFNPHNKINVFNYIHARFQQLQNGYKEFMSRLYLLKQCRLDSSQFLIFQEGGKNDSITTLFKQLNEQQDQNAFSLQYESRLQRIIGQVLEIVYYLETNGFELYYLTPEAIQLSGQDKVILGDYFQILFNKVDFLKCVPSNMFPYLPPEMFYLKQDQEVNNNCFQSLSFGFKGCVWSLGVIVLQIYDQVEFFKQFQFNNNQNIKKSFTQDMFKIMKKYKNKPIFQKFKFLQENQSNLELLLSGYNLNGVSHLFRDFLSNMLQLSVEKRYSVLQLLNHPFLKQEQPLQNILDIQNQQIDYEKQLLHKSKFFEFDVIWNILQIQQLSFQQHNSESDDFIFENMIINSQIIESPKTLEKMLSDSTSSYMKHSDQLTKKIINCENNNAILMQDIFDLTESMIRQKIHLKTSQKTKQFLCDFISSFKSKQFTSQSQIASNIIKINENVSLPIDSVNDCSTAIQQQQQSMQQFSLDSNSSPERLTWFTKIKQKTKQIINTQQPKIVGTNLTNNNQTQIDIQPEKNSRIDQNQINRQYAILIIYLTLAQDVSQLSKQFCFRLFYSYPLSSHLLSLRRQLWRKLLQIEYDPSLLYDFCQDMSSIANPQSIKQSLRQLEHDVSRCHQYHPIFNSEFGKNLLYQVVKVFLALEGTLAKEMQYVQGMDSICAVALHAADFNPQLACLFFHAIYSKCLKEVNVKEQLVLFKRLLRFCEPQLSLHLEQIEFNAEMYAVTWFLTLFANSFPLDKLSSIFDLMICDPNFIIVFAVAILADLKARLLLMGQNDCMGMFRSLEGIVCIDLCKFFAGKICEALPGSFFIFKNSADYEINQNQNQNQTNDVPYVIEIKNQLIMEIASYDLMNLEMPPVIIDIRSLKEFETQSIINSYHMQPDSKTQMLHSIHIEFLKIKNKSNFSIDAISKCKSRRDYVEIGIPSLLTCSSGRENLSIVIIVGQLSEDGNSSSMRVANQLLAHSIKYVTFLKGGIKTIANDVPDLIAYNQKPTNLNYFKKQLNKIDQNNK